MLSVKLTINSVYPLSAATFLINDADKESV